MLVVCEVALGNCMDFIIFQLGIIVLFGGYYSCYGVKIIENDLIEFWVSFVKWCIYEKVFISLYFKSMCNGVVCVLFMFRYIYCMLFYCL